MVKLELLGAVVLLAAAVALGMWALDLSDDADASTKLVPVEATFSAADFHHDVTKTNAKTGVTSTGDETMVDAVFKLDGKTYRHRVPEEQVLRVVKSLPGKGTLLVNPKDPTSPPRVTPVGSIAVPALACIFTALGGVALLLAAVRGRRRQ
jgi:hypothetical protein